MIKAIAASLDPVVDGHYKFLVGPTQVATKGGRLLIGLYNYEQAGEWAHATPSVPSVWPESRRPHALCV